MKTKFSIVLLTLVVILFSAASCKKYAGPGGKATISGKIQGNKYDGANNLLASYPKSQYDVYIIYDNEGEESNVPNDDVETSYDGSFSFNFLQKGSYRIYTYTECPSCASGDSVIIHSVEITAKDETIDLGTINIRD